MLMLVQLSQWIVAQGAETVTFTLVLARAGGLIVGAPFWSDAQALVPRRAGLLTDVGEGLVLWLGFQL